MPTCIARPSLGKVIKEDPSAMHPITSYASTVLNAAQMRGETGEIAIPPRLIAALSHSALRLKAWP